MSWNIAQARQRLSEIVRQAAAEPQLIYNRKRLVAAVINEQDYRAFKEWLEHRAQRTLADEAAELRRVMQEERYELTIPPRSDRPNALVPEAVEDRHDLPG
jgi:PHD/YefM family antitoxin component YafN of YafNO toxin-antitoxin module